jgi:hypothetical protein
MLHIHDGIYEEWRETVRSLSVLFRATQWAALLMKRMGLLQPLLVILGS